MTERIDTLLTERRSFSPTAAFRGDAHVRTPAIYAKARRNPTRFWAEQAGQLRWFKPWKQVLRANAEVLEAAGDLVAAKEARELWERETGKAWS